MKLCIYALYQAEAVLLFMRMYAFVFVCIFYVKRCLSFRCAGSLWQYEMAIHFTFVMCIVFFSVKTMNKFIHISAINCHFIQIYFSRPVLEHSPVGHMMCCIIFLIFEYFPDVWNFCSFIWNPLRTQILISLLIYNFKCKSKSAFRIISDLQNCLFVIYIIYELRLFK